MATKRTVSLVIEYKNGQLVTREMNQTADAADRVNKNVERTEKSLTAAKLQSIAFGASATYALKQVWDYLKQGIDLANQNEAAWIGLQSVARSFGANMKVLRKDFDDLRKSGMLTDTAIINSQKNLVAMGFSAEQSGKLLSAFADVAAFNRQGQLDLNQALEGGTSGLRNNMSQMIDNMGIQKNFSIILRDAGISQQDWNEGVDRGNNLQRLYAQLLKESAFAQGDLQRLSESNAGATARYDQAMMELNRTMGELANTILPGIIRGFTAAARAANDFVQASKSGQSTPGILESVLTLGASPLAYALGTMYGEMSVPNVARGAGNPLAPGGGFNPQGTYSLNGKTFYSPPPAALNLPRISAASRPIGGDMGIPNVNIPAMQNPFLKQLDMSNPPGAGVGDRTSNRMAYFEAEWAKAFDGTNQGMQQMAGVAQSSAVTIANAFAGAFAGIASGAQSVGDAMLGALLGALGTIATMWGSFFVSYGIGMSFVPGGQVAWGAVAKGAALMALGGILQGLAAGAGTGTNSGGTGMSVGRSGGGAAISVGGGMGGPGGGQTIIVISADGRASSGGSDVGRALSSAGVSRNAFRTYQKISEEANRTSGSY